MSRIIRKKTWPRYFDAVLNGQKKYEMRLNDFVVEEGDVLLLEEWDPETKQYTGRSVKKTVGYVGKFKLDELFWSKEEVEEKGLVILSLDD